VESVLTAFEVEVQPLANELPLAVIQGDFNDANVIVGPNSNTAGSRGGGGQHGSESVGVVGVIDFGDMVKSWRVNEIAIAVAYAMVGGYGKQPGKRLLAAFYVLQGFASQFSLLPVEVDVLRVLVACRLACSHTMGCYSFSKDPGNEYLLLHAGPAAEALHDWFVATPKSELEAMLHSCF
jgi:hydroxylysine kinase